MSIVIRPGRFVGEVHPVGKLAATMLSVTVASMGDPARFRRGRALQLEGAVQRLEIDAGTLRASVVGSRPDPYSVVISAPTIDRPTGPVGDSSGVARSMIAGLLPDKADVLTSCSCPDFDDPCKHSMAALLAFAEQLTSQPRLLVEWRCHSTDGRRAEVGSRRSRDTTDRHLRLATPASDDRPSAASTAASPATGSPGSAPGQTDTTAPRQRPAARTPEQQAMEHPDWAAFVGSVGLAPPVVPEVSREPASVGNARMGTIDLGGWVRSALEQLRRDD